MDKTLRTRAEKISEETKPNPHRAKTGQFARFWKLRVGFGFKNFAPI